MKKLAVLLAAAAAVLAWIAAGDDWTDSDDLIA